MNKPETWLAQSERYRQAPLLDYLVSIERDTLIFRLVALMVAAATLRFWHEDVTEISVAPAAALSVAYLVYTFLLGRVIIPWRAPRLSLGLASPTRLVFLMIFVDTAVLSALLYMVGGPEGPRNASLVILPLFIIYHSLYLGYLSCFFSATLFSLFFVIFAYAWDQGDFVTSFIALLIPFFYLLAVFGGYLGERRLKDRWEKEQLRQLAREERRPAEAGVVISGQGESDEGVDSVLRTVIADSSRLTGLAGCLLTVLGGEGDVLVGRAANVKPADLKVRSLEALVFDADGDPVTSEALQSGKAVIVTEAVLHEHRLPAWARGFGVGVLVAIPLIAAGRTWGVMYLFDTYADWSGARGKASIAERYAKLAAGAIADALLDEQS